MSPSAITRAVVENVARRGRKAAVLVKVVRSMVAVWEVNWGGGQQWGVLEDVT